MKCVQLEKHLDLEKRTKSFSIDSKLEDSKAKTRIQKNFSYVVDNVMQEGEQCSRPLVFINKSLDTKTGVELFSFHVKGYFYMTYQRKMMRVRFCHKLDIEIHWKDKVFSPKKSVTLT